MAPTSQYPSSRRSLFTLIGVMTSVLLILAAYQALAAEDLQAVAVDLDSSTKQVDNQRAEPGSRLQYKVTLTNGGDEPALGVVMTDTLPSAVEYITPTLTLSPEIGTPSVSEGAIHWTGDLDAGASVEITYDVMLSDDIAIGTVVSNMAEIAYSDQLIQRSASTTVTLYSYLPVVFKPLPAPILEPIDDAVAPNDWTVSWTVSGEISGITGFELQEADNPSFANPSTIALGPGDRSANRSLPATSSNEHYYRVRVFADGENSGWSNVRSVIGAYMDNFDDPASGWSIRRQDTDDVFNQLFYTNGELKHRIHGRWDYMIAAPMRQAVEPPYRIEARVRVDSPNNLHAYGIIFGGDWDGTRCPYDPGNGNYKSCFTKYYRLLTLWYGSPDKLRTSLKRIDYHDPASNAGRGVDLIGFQDVTVRKPPKDYQVWAVEVYPVGYRSDGVTIRVLVNGNLVGEAYDAHYLMRPYFGTFTADDEYGGLDVRYDWYRVSLID